MGNKKFKKHEIIKFRNQAISNANEGIKTFLKENKVALNVLIEELLKALAAKDRKKVLELSYKLSSAGTTFNRPDLSNIGDFIQKIYFNPAFVDRYDLLVVFHHALKLLSSKKKYDEQFTQTVLAKIRSKI